jgi:hypothetical protein
MESPRSHPAVHSSKTFGRPETPMPGSLNTLIADATLLEMRLSKTKSVYPVEYPWGGI